jgi:hypothetical protein
MSFLALFLRGLAVLPSLIQGIESIFGAQTGPQKKAAALDMVGSTMKVTDAVTSKTIVNADGFTSGLSSIIDGVVTCMNASVWSKQ